jgi:threonine aldolase
MTQKFIDLRSDTVTKPTPAMRQAMAEAEVGDDVFGEDPTVRALEEKTAALLGHEAALFCPTGTMANQIAVFLHTRKGDEALLEAKAHIVLYELGAMAALSGVMPRLLDSPRGFLGVEQVAAAIRPGSDLFQRTALLCLENTHNMQGGTVWLLEELHAVRAATQAAGVKVHLDGARLWNAAVSSGRAPHEIAAGFDSVMVSLSKGLGCPVGSMLAGSRGFILAARQARKRFGGGMRQAGILAAAGLHALDHHRERLADDHANAKELARRLAELPGLKLDASTVETNIVIAELTGTAPGAPEFLAALKQRGVLAVPVGPRAVRFVTHLDIDAGDVTAAIVACAAVLKN